MSLLFSTGAIAGSAAKGAPGMVLLTPTSIAHSGTSASIGANGQVTFTAVTSLSLNGVFSADFDNYVISMRNVGTGGNNLLGRLRTSGSDATASNYVWQYLDADNTSISAGRFTTSNWRVGAEYTTARTGNTVYLYGPYLAQPTAYRLIDVDGYLSASIADAAGTHSLSTSYDGITIYTTGSNITGALQVYGVRS